MARRTARTRCSGVLRSECPVHWTGGIPDYPGEPGYWSVTRPEDIHAVSRDWRTYSSSWRHHVGRRVPARAHPLDVHRDGPAPARPPEDAVPGRLHAEADRRARARDQGDRGRRARPPGRTGGMRSGHRSRAAGRLPGHRKLHGDPARGRCGVGRADERGARGRGPGHRAPTGSTPCSSTASRRSSVDAGR